MRKYILVIDTLCEGVRPAWWDDQDKPVVHNTLREANLELVEEIEDLIEKFRDDKGAEEMEAPESYVACCTIREDGAIVTEEGDVIYDPAVGR